MQSVTVLETIRATREMRSMTSVLTDPHAFPCRARWRPPCEPLCSPVSLLVLVIWLDRIVSRRAISTFCVFVPAFAVSAPLPCPPRVVDRSVGSFHRVAARLPPECAWVLAPLFNRRAVLLVTSAVPAPTQLHDAPSTAALSTPSSGARCLSGPLQHHLHHHASARSARSSRLRCLGAQHSGLHAQHGAPDPNQGHGGGEGACTIGSTHATIRDACFRRSFDGGESWRARISSCAALPR